ncbi:MAG: hypothetical protein Q8R90_02680 [Bacteroidales bacterium]|jgi:hypothetical protein|nr:hypothetical protein [Bacteroidales bacterium]
MTKNNITVILSLLLIISCNNSLYKIRGERVIPVISHANYNDSGYSLKYRTDESTVSKSFTYTRPDGKEIIINEAVRDEESGEMVRLRHLDEVFVSAKSRNISERDGIIRMDFMIRIPESLQKSDWQTSLLPVISRGDDTIHLKKIILTGYGFKRSQERGYRRYERFLRSIIPDDADFIEIYTDLPNLAIFLERNLPQSKIISGIENDTILTHFGIGEKRILEQYIKKWLIERNNRKKAEREQVFSRYVKNPYMVNARLDSVIKMVNGDFAYHYSQELITNENSKRISLNVYGEVRDIWGSTVVLPSSDTLTYYVSSMLNFTDTTTRYKREIVERRVTESVDFKIFFRAGRSDIDRLSGQNPKELLRMKEYLGNIHCNDIYSVDSLLITSYSSPEGPLKLNERLALERGRSILSYITLYSDSISADSHQERLNVRVKGGGEDWESLLRVIESDAAIRERAAILNSFSIINQDLREREISRFREDYRYLKDSIYPLLRRVNLSFHLSRRDMVRDTIHTTVKDTLYMNGVKLLEKRKYTEALVILREYRDINTVIASLSLGMVKSASEILNTLPMSAQVIYLKAIICAREGDEEGAVRYFLQSRDLNPSMGYRGILDPEISYLIKKYNLNKESGE